MPDRLRQLERDGLVLRTYHPEVPPRVEYEISELGQPGDHAVSVAEGASSWPSGTPPARAPRPQSADGPLMTVSRRDIVRRSAAPRMGRRAYEL